jgi:hypothetical protein
MALRYQKKKGRCGMRLGEQFRVEEGFREMCFSSGKERVVLVLQEKKGQERG